MAAVIRRMHGISKKQVQIFSLPATQYLVRLTATKQSNLLRVNMQSAKRLILSMLKHYLFWLALFAFARLLFLLWNREELDGISSGHILFAFVKGLYVDTAMACYLLTI